MAKAIKIEKAKAILKDADDDEQFWINDGPTVKNYQELQQAMSAITDESFNHHVNEERNDFSNWVRDVQGDDALANNLLKANSRKESEDSIRQRIEELKGIVENKAITQTKIKKTKAKPGKKAVKQVKKKTSKNIETEKQNTQKDKSKSHKITDYIIAITALVATIGIVNMLGFAITGAAVANIGEEGIVPLGITTIVATIILVALVVRAANK